MTILMSVESQNGTEESRSIESSKHMKMRQEEEEGQGRRVSESLTARLDKGDLDSAEIPPSTGTHLSRYLNIDRKSLNGDP